MVVVSEEVTNKTAIISPLNINKTTIGMVVSVVSEQRERAELASLWSEMKLQRSPGPGDVEARGWRDGD